MSRVLDEAGLADLGEGTTLVEVDSGQVAWSCYDPDGVRWLQPGVPGGLTDADLCAAGNWTVLRHAVTHADALPPPTDGLDAYSTDGGMISVRRTGHDGAIPVAMCVSADWARSLAQTLNAAEPEAYPLVVAAAQRVTDLQAEYARRDKVRDRLDENTRQAVASILGVLGLSMNLPGVGTTPALVAIKERCEQLWRRDHRLTGAVLSAAASLWPDAPASELDDLSAVVDRLAAEVRRLRTLLDTDPDENLRRAVARVQETAASHSAVLWPDRKVSGNALDVLDRMTGEIEMLRRQLRRRDVSAGDEPVPGVPARGGTGVARHG